MEQIEVRALKKEYDMGSVRVHALKGVDFTIDRGELMAVWGPSGSGKTTLPHRCKSRRAPKSRRQGCSRSTLLQALANAGFGALRLSRRVEKMAYNRPDPQVHHWFIPGMYLQHTVNSILARIFSLFAILFMQLWGLLNLLGVLDEPSSGCIHFNGREITGLSDNQKTALRNDSIGFIFQGFNLIPVLSALENVMLPLQIKGLSASRAKEKAFQCLNGVELSEFAHHRPDKMSGGQQQRVSIARALATDPSLIIADEPTANLDSGTAGKIIGLLRDLNEKNNTTIIFATHDQRLLDQIDRQICIEDGRIRNGGVAS